MNMLNTDTYNAANVIARSERDGWKLGYIGIPWPGPWPKLAGDLFVTDPEGRQAGLAWESTGPDMIVLSGPTRGRWGVLQVRFPISVMSEDDLIRNFHAILPFLQRERENVSGNAALYVSA
jgi:hypothetical protein